MHYDPGRQIADRKVNGRSGSSRVLWTEPHDHNSSCAVTRPKFAYDTQGSLVQWGVLSWHAV